MNDTATFENLTVGALFISDKGRKGGLIMQADTGYRNMKGKEMSEEREKMDVYTGSDEGEQIDMWLFVPGLRPQFDAIDNLTLKRESFVHRLKSERSGRVLCFWQRLTSHRPWQRHIRSAGAGS